METRETITLDRQAQQRLWVLNHVLAGEVTAREAAAYLHLSVRSVRRLLVRYHPDEGAAALVHGNRGRIPANRLDDELRARLVELASTTYQGVNRAHLADLLAEREGIVVAERTLRRVLAEAGLPAVRRRRPRGHRLRRERMAQAGMLLQVDGSQHDWLEDRGPRLTLVGGIDDATGLVTGATFREQEDTAGYLEVLIQTARAYGLPLGLYSDRHGIFTEGPAAGAHARGAVRRTRLDDAAGPCPRGRRHRLGGRPERPGQGSRRTALGHRAGPPSRGAAPGRGDDAGGGEPRPRRLGPPSQRPLRHRGRRS
jgi:transposase